MQVRATTTKRGNKTYQYAQLVESYRRESDGVPVHRVVANLGRITDPVQLDNLKAAFAANRSGERLAPVARGASQPAAGARIRRPLAILRYLDVAVVVVASSLCSKIYSTPISASPIVPPTKPTQEHVHDRLRSAARGTEPAGKCRLWQVCHAGSGGAMLCRTYRAKDAVENDFRITKSLARLRHVRHRTDAKIRAHVTLCGLALYVQRELTTRLRKDATGVRRPVIDRIGSGPACCRA